MPKVKISEYSATANSNTDVASINIDEGCAPSGINNAIRAVMGHLKDFQQGTYGDPFNGPVNGALNGTVGATTPSTGAFTTLSATGNVTLGDASTDTLNVGNGGLIKDSSGNLGLGVTPSANAGQSTLNIANYNRTFSALTLGSNANSAGYVGYNMGNTSASNTWKYISADTGSALYFAGNEMRFMQFASGSAGATTSGTQAMTLDASGNLGIGTTSPVGRVDAAMTTGSLTGYALSLGGVEVGSLKSNSSTGEVRIGGTYTNYFPTFYSSGSERARITSGGYFKASNSGTYANVSADFHEINNSTDNAEILFLRSTATSNPYGMTISWNSASPNDTTRYFLRCDDSTAQRFTARSNGGLANYSANDVNLSDRREKTNFAPAGSYLDKICAIPVQTFNYIDQNLEEDAGLTLGVVAQDVQAVAPELVMESNWASKDDEPKMRLSIYQTDLQYALMKCIQEQQALITQLTARITALESA